MLGKPTSLVLGLAVILVCVGSGRDDRRALLNKIFSGDQFYLECTQYGGYFPVRDSVFFVRKANITEATYTHLTPGYFKASQVVTDEQLGAIQKVLLRRSRLYRTKCDNVVITVVGGADFLIIPDTDCEAPMILEIQKSFNFEGVNE